MSLDVLSEAPLRAAALTGGPVEPLHANERTTVTRVRSLSSGGTLICKQLHGADAVRRRRHEQAMLERLAGVAGVVQLAELPCTDALLLHDWDGAALSQRTGAPLPPATWLPFALRLARVLAAVHRAGVIHKDINPGNILISHDGERPLLIDFDLATAFAEERPAFVHHLEIAGTLAYLAPEQTGRTGRPVDQRADLYALGCTLYELACGRPPFQHGDALQLVHDHLARLPEPPIRRVPGLPAALSDIVMRLLEKEPDRRYQSAEGLAHDLARLAEPQAAEHGPFVLGERDFPARLAPPSQLVGRRAELAELRSAFEAALVSPQRGLFVTGAPGVGKTALINELKPMVAARRGWFVYGKFDQYRQDGAGGAVLSAMSALGRLLLAEPDEALARQRARTIRALGPDAGVVTAQLPEYLHLLGPQPEPAPLPPAEMAVRSRLAVLTLLRSLALADRPLVMFLDDLQWAGQASIEFIHAVLTDDELRGVLLVGTWRSAEVDLAHPLTAMQERCARLQREPRRLDLQNLPRDDVALLLQQMLRLPPQPAAELCDLVLPHTDGNPFDSIELVNALRHAGVLQHPGTGQAAGWHWDEPAIRRWVGHGNVVDLLAQRIARLPQAAQRVVELVACLGGGVDLSLLQVTAGLQAPALALALAPALEDGLLVIDQASRSASAAAHGGDTVRLRHDRVQQAAYGSLPLAHRQALHLAAARCLAAWPEHTHVAAEQYLAAVEAITDPAEQATAAGLFAAAAAQAHRASLFATEERFLRSALERLAKAGAAGAQRAPLQVQHHAALYVLGRLDDADQAYAEFVAAPQDPLLLAVATGNQVNNLAQRGRHREALALGMEVLQQLGITDHTPVDAARLRVELDGLCRFAEQADLRRDLASAAPPAMVQAAALLINRMMAPAYYGEQGKLPWLLFESRRLWREHGPCAPLVATLGAAPLVIIPRRQDYVTGYRIVRHVVAVGEARGWAAEVAWARHCLSIFVQHWFEPLEDCIVQARRAREGLLRGGDLQFACFTHYTTLAALLDSAATLEEWETELQAALAFARRTGNRNFETTMAGYQWLAQALRGDVPADDADFSQMPYLQRLAAIPHGVAATLLGDLPALERHSAAAMAVLPGIEGQYWVALVRLQRALALAQRLRTPGGAEDAPLRAELAQQRDWLMRRAEAAPANFQHLLWLVEAEMAWTAGDVAQALQRFDEALAGAQHFGRPWHAALIAERAGTCRLAHGLQFSGRALLREARRRYANWGAREKLRQLDARHMFLHDDLPDARLGAPRHTTTLSSDTIDLVAILRASQALSSQTSLVRLQDQVGQLLRELTGATHVAVALWTEDTGAWQVAGADGATPLPVEEAARAGLFSLSPLRYVERTREPLLVEDALRDDRFARDPYFAARTQCALLVLPILSQGQLRAVLLLENHLARAAFSAHRLDAVKLIAGQLAVSLDNALLYASLERKVAERTEALGAANRRLEALSVTDALTGVANRRRFDTALESEWARARRSQLPLAVAMIDIDQFKLYNDHYGHPAGDLCIQRVAQALAGCVRAEVDLLARYGGEEFALVLPGADLATGRAAAERAGQAVAELRLPHERATHGILTVSVGVAAVWPGPDLTADALLRSADEALYRAKRGGRNRVEV